MTVAKKSTTKTVEPAIVEDEFTEPTPIEDEVQAEEAGEDEDPKRTFTIELHGEPLVLEDAFPEGKIPAALMFLTPKSSDVQLAHFGGLALQQILGDEQLMRLFELGASTEDLQSVVPAWRDARGLGK